MTETVQGTALAVPAQAAITPMQIILSAYQSAIEHGAGMEVVNSIASQMREERDYKAREAFNQALARVQANARIVKTNCKNNQTGSRYANFAALDKMLRPLYIAEGLSVSYGTGETDKLDIVRVTCDVSLDGYTRPYYIDMPADGKGPKGNDVMTKTHATGSAVMYGRRNLLVMIFNLTQEDDDGNAAAGMDIKTFAPLMDAIEGARTVAEVTAAYIRALKASKTDQEKANFEAAAIRRKGELK